MNSRFPIVDCHLPCPHWGSCRLQHSAGSHASNWTSVTYFTAARWRKGSPLSYSANGRCWADFIVKEDPKEKDRMIGAPAASRSESDERVGFPGRLHRFNRSGGLPVRTTSVYVMDASGKLIRSL